jgi:hypothetical protein
VVIVEEEAVPPPAMDAYENAVFCVRCCKEDEDEEALGVGEGPLIAVAPALTLPT